MDMGEAEAARPALELQIKTADDATTVLCRGKLIVETSELLKREVKSRIAAKKRLVLDLSDLAKMDSSGLGAIVAIYVSAKAAGCELELINLNKQVRELLRLTNLLSVFATCGEQGIRLQ
jgi:anti-sigma B factor antagonist